MVFKALKYLILVLIVLNILTSIFVFAVWANAFFSGDPTARSLNAFLLLVCVPVPSIIFSLMIIVMNKIHDRYFNKSL